MVQNVKNKCFKNDVMQPLMAWIENRPKAPDANMIKSNRQYLIYWRENKGKLPAADTAVFYSIYRVKGKNPNFKPSPKNFLKFTDNCDLRLFTKGKSLFGRKKYYTYKITSFNRYHVESEPSKAIIIKYGKKDRVE